MIYISLDNVIQSLVCARTFTPILPTLFWGFQPKFLPDNLVYIHVYIHVFWIDQNKFQTSLYTCHHTSVQVSLHKFTHITQTLSWTPTPAADDIEITVRFSTKLEFPSGFKPLLLGSCQNVCLLQEPNYIWTWSNGVLVQYQKVQSCKMCSLSLSLSLSLSPYRSIDWCLNELQLCVLLIFHWSGLPHIQRTNS